LKKKFYVREKDELYHLSIKGLATALFIDPDLMDVVIGDPLWQNPKQQIRKILRKVSRGFKKQGVLRLGKKAFPTARNFIGQLQTREGLKKLVDGMKEILNLGFNLDLLNDEYFVALLWGSPNLQGVT
jgi:hypothetical protein